MRLAPFAWGMAEGYSPRWWQIFRGRSNRGGILRAFRPFFPIPPCMEGKLRYISWFWQRGTYASFVPA